MNISLTCDTAVEIIMTRSREEEVSKVKVGDGGMPTITVTVSLRRHLFC